MLLGAVRDEFLRRPWDPPAAYWSAGSGPLVGGRDEITNGTWLAVRPDRPAVAAVLNGARLPVPASGARPSRGPLPLRVLAGDGVPDGAELADYDGFHLLLATRERVDVWSWDGVALVARELAPGDHIIVNLGVDAAADPLVPHFAPLLAATPTAAPAPGQPTAMAWPGWVELLRGDGLDFDDPRALIERREFNGQVYGSSSAALVALGASGVRYDFTADPAHPDWREIHLTGEFS